MRIDQVVDGVHMVTGTNVNWVLISDGDAVTVVDAGYPRDGRLLLDSLAAIGHRPQDVQAVLLTHAHLDHIGGIPTLLARHQVPVLTGAVEAGHARREFLEQVTPAQLLALCYRPRGVIWVAQTMRAVVPHAAMAVPTAQAIPDGVPLDLPGHPVPVATPGHTSGHTAYLIPAAGLVCTGDALVTAHPLLTGRPRPQFLPGVFSEDTPAMRRSLRVLGDLPADVLAPGHGPVHRQPLDQVAGRLESRLGS